jgi:type II secretory ATPase GspE/PulE/Tfp pilus assembly ATPase PilB-like protein
MRRHASSKGSLTLREDGLLKALRGLTTVDEVVRITGAALETADDVGASAP